MPDPLSVAGSVAGLITLGAAVSKLFLQFYRSIHDAPSNARILASALYTLNIALSQVQGNLLNAKFVIVADDQQIEALQECLAGCEATFESLDTAIRASGFLNPDQALLQKSWASIKAYFDEEKISDYICRLEREKTTLLVVLGNFSAYHQSSVNIQVAELIYLLADYKPTP